MVFSASLGLLYSISYSIKIQNLAACLKTDKNPWQLDLTFRFSNESIIWDVWLKKITRRTTGAQGCKFLTSFERFWRVFNFIEPIFRSTLIYFNLFRSITFFLGLSIAIWLSLAIMGYLRLSRSISCYFRISFAISGYFWLSSVIFGYLLLFLAKSCYIRLYPAI